MAKTLNVGVVGVGGIVHTHMPGWENSPFTEVVAGCDVNEENLKNWGEKWDVKKLSLQVRDLLEDKSIDIIDICTPNRFHAPITIAALEKGKHVICEKPLAPTPEEVKTMIEARDKSGKMLMTAQHHRFEGTSKSMKAEINAGALGDIYHARAWQLRRNLFPGNESFWLKKNSGGGACIDIGVHALDLTMWLMGNPKPIAVSGISRNILSKQKGMFSGWGKAPVPEGGDVEEFAAAFVRFENNISLILEVSWLLHHPATGEERLIWLYGTEGGALYPKCEIYKTNFATQQLYNTSLQLTQNINEPHAQECIEFAEAIVNGAPSPVPAEQSLHVMAILDGVYKSQKTGKEVTLEL